MTLHNAGKSAAEIRDTIDATYLKRYRFSTPTPHPPHGSPPLP
jgi:hypothetical protein